MGRCFLITLVTGVLLACLVGVGAQDASANCTCAGRPVGWTTDPCAPACSTSFCSCVLGGTCSQQSCGVGTVFNPATFSCDLPSNVDGCRRLPRSLGPISAPSPANNAPNSPSSANPPAPVNLPTETPATTAQTPSSTPSATNSTALTLGPTAPLTPDNDVPEGTRGTGSAIFSPPQSAPNLITDVGAVPGRLPAAPKGEKGLSTAVKIAVSAAVVALVLMVFCAIGIMCGRNLAKFYCGPSPTDFRHASWNPETADGLVPVVPPGRGKPPTPKRALKQHFGPGPIPYKDIYRATGGFDELNFLGEGGFGTVYFGRLPTGQAVAVKRASTKNKETELQFKNEVRILSSMEHANLVRLLGFCEEEGELLLVYDYCANGPLTPHLLGLATPLKWELRLKIALGAAKGLNHLHLGGGKGKGWIHRDVKADNILLDEAFEAKITDVGLSRLPPRDTGDLKKAPLRVKGTLGYVDPDYLAGNSLTPKSDVWSFGVVLLQLISGKPAVDVTQSPEKRQSLVDWARPFIRDRRYTPLVDPTLGGRYSVESLVHIATLAARCTQRMPQLRPTMVDVVRELEHLVEQADEVPLDDSSVGSDGEAVSKREDVKDWGMSGISMVGRALGGVMTPKREQGGVEMTRGPHKGEPSGSERNVPSGSTRESNVVGTNRDSRRVTRTGQQEPGRGVTLKSLEREPKDRGFLRNKPSGRL